MRVESHIDAVRKTNPDEEMTMMYQPYKLAHDCPRCGQKDAPHEWRGARMSSTAWGHDFSCCSEECGTAFASTWRICMETKAGRKQLAELWQKLEGQCEWRLSGEPYYGYDAEQMLKHRRF